MAFYLAGLNGYVLFGVIFLSISTISILVLLIVHNFFYQWTRQMMGDRFLVPFFTINGAVLGLLLAMVLVETWKNYQREKENITDEVSNYINIYRSTRGLDSTDSVKAKQYIKQIIKATIETSWPEMRKGGDGIVVTRLTNNFQLFLLQLKAKNSEQENIKKIMLENINKASELKRHRFLKASEEVVPEPMWVIILCCIFISIFSGFVFAIKPMSIHIILTLFQCTMISFVLFLMFVFMYPYRGPMSIKPKSFERLLNTTLPTIDND